MEKLKLIKCWKTLLLLMCMSMFSASIFAQGITLRGKVVDSKGEPLIGATVKVTATPSTAATTNISGDFTLRVPASTTKITISYVGYVSVDLTVKANSGNLGDIPLANDANSLSEVVVVGYGVQNKRDVTGSTVSIDEKSLAEVPSAGVVNQLEGKVAGLDVVGGQIRIRGNRTIGAGPTSGADAPLLVVDGAPYQGSINDVNPQDIKNVEVLKDASATAIYGSRGSGGVILITTNRGRVGRSITTLDSYFGLSNVAQEFKNLNAAQYQQLKLDAVTGAVLQAGTPAASAAAITQGYPLSSREVAGIAAGTQTDWQKLLYQTAMVSDNTLGISGGTEATQFNVSAGYRVSTGLEPLTRAERYNMQVEVDHQVSKSIKIGVNSTNTLNFNIGGGGNQGNAIQISPLINPFLPNGDLDSTPWFGQLDVSNVNPLYAKYNGSAFYNNTRNFHSVTNMYAEWSILKDLKYRVSGSFNFSQGQGANYNGINVTGITTQSLTTASISDNTSYTYTLDNLLTYDHTFGKHHINFTGLFSNEKYHQDGISANVTNVPADVNQAYNLAQSTPGTIGNGNGYSENGIVSEMARIAYSYDARYALTATVRNDASSELAVGHQYIAYPALGAAWNISNEKWMQQYGWVDNLKLRFGYGVTSNGPMGGSAYQTLGALTGNTYEYGSIAGGNAAGLLVGTLVNANLRWQKTGEYNLGIDFGVLKDRLTGTVEVYSDRTTDIILNNSLPGTIGGGPNQATNLGISASKGLEVSLSSINIQNKGGFSWTTDFNIAFSRERIVALPNGIPANIGSGEFVGWPLNVIYDNKKIGIWQLSDATQSNVVDSKGVPIINPQTGTPFQTSTAVSAQSSPKQYPGQIRVQDVNGDGKIDASDNQIVGTFQPQYTGGITNRFSYKGLDLSIVINARMGMTSIVPFLSTGGSTGGYAYLGTGRRNQPYVNAWTPSNPGGTWPEPNDAAQTVTYASTLQYFDGSWIKARSINLGYTIPSRYLAKAGISSLRVYLNCTNPFVIYAPITKYSDGVDPEGSSATAVATSNGGSDPRAVGLNISEYARQFILGINLRF